jgi:hypothetical protein
MAQEKKTLIEKLPLDKMTLLFEKKTQQTSPKVGLPVRPRTF